MKKLALKELDSLFAAIAAQQALYLPQDDAAGQEFAAWKEGAALSKRLNTARSAKDLFFPQVENLAGFKREGKSIEIFETREDVQPFTVFGVRATRSTLPGARWEPLSRSPVQNRMRPASAGASTLTRPILRATCRAGWMRKLFTGRPIPRRVRRSQVSFPCLKTAVRKL